MTLNGPHDPLGMIVAVLAALALAGAAASYWRNGTLKAAVETINILKSQLEAVKADRDELSRRVETLETETRVLRELVTNAAKFEEFAQRVETMHQTRADQYASILAQLQRLSERV